MKFQRKPAGKAKKEEVQKRASRSLPPNMLRLYTSPLFFFLFLFHRDVVEGYYYGKSERIPIREIFTRVRARTRTYIDPHTIDLLPMLQCWPSKFFFDVKKKFKSRVIDSNNNLNNIKK